MPNILVAGCRSGNVEFQCRFVNDEVVYNRRCSKSKWLLRANVDNDIAEAREVPEANRNPQEKLLAKQKIYFTDDQGNFDESKLDEWRSINSPLEEEERRLLDRMRKTPTIDTNTACLVPPSQAIATLIESQSQSFGGAKLSPLGSILTRLNSMELDDLTTFNDVEERVRQVALAATTEVIAATGFDLNMTMEDCRKDATMKKIVKDLAGDGSNLLDVEAYETTTVRIAMQLVRILVEQKALLGLISGRLHAYKRKNGRIAIWSKLPEWLRKFYCIGTARRLNLTSRSADFHIVEGNDYIVSQIRTMLSGMLWW